MAIPSQAPATATWSAAVGPDWQVEPPAVVARHLLHAASRRSFLGAPLRVADPVLRASLAEQDRAPQWEYAYRWPGPVLVEPVHGYLVTAPGRLVAESVPYSRHVGPPPPLTAAPALRVPALVSLREDGDGNYYHFLDDVLGRFELLDRLGVDPGLPVLISPRLAAAGYFRTALELSAALRARQWLVQDGPVEAGEVVFAKPLPHAPPTLAAVADLFDVRHGDPAGERRLLVLRDPKRGRHLTQGAEVEALCRERGFEPVDCDRLTMREQVALFRQARHVVGPHGAGLVNLLWRRGAPADLLELFPPDTSPAHYHWLCTSFGFGYDALRGVDGSAATGFRVDLDALAAALPA